MLGRQTEVLTANTEHLNCNKVKAWMYIKLHVNMMINMKERMNMNIFT